MNPIYRNASVEPLGEEFANLPGGIVKPEGFKGVVSVHFRQDGDILHPVSDLGDVINIIQEQGVSVSLDRGPDDKTKGMLRCRVIQDRNGRAYIFRKDDNEGGKSHSRFVVRWADNVL